jgi:signal transduction histidine kinase
MRLIPRPSPIVQRLLPISVMLLGGCAEPSQPAASRTLRFALSEPVATLQPPSLRGLADQQLLRLLYDGLTRTDVEGRIAPGLASRWESVDGSTWTFTVPRGRTFHDGTPITPNDVVRSWTALGAYRDKAPIAPLLEDIDGMAAVLAGEATAVSGLTAPDDTTLVVRLRRPLVAFPIVVSRPEYAVGIARVDCAGRIITANSRFMRLLALEQGAAPPDWASVFAVPAERTQFLQGITSQTPLSSVLWTWKDSAQRTRVVRASTVPLPTGEGEPGAIVLTEDVTEQHALESQLQRTQKMELVGRLAGGIAHDFNNLLTVVRGNVSALGGVTAAPELGAIDDAAARGARLVRRLLTISRNDMLTLAPVPPGPLLYDVIEMVRSVLPARIVVEAPLQVPDVTLMIDRDSVEQSLLNLALNARDAIAGPGTLRFGAREVRSPSGTCSLVISVADDGDGMPADVLARATEPFFSTKTPDRGTGLGLSVVNSTMERMGGRLELRSTPGQGTRAELWFPVATAPSPDTTTAAKDTAVTTAAPGLRLLLVDDELAVRVATERALRSFGHTVMMASGMREALTILHDADAIDLVITDVMMPVGTGIDLLRAARSAGHTVPMLFVSGYAMESLEGILESDPRTGMLTKPWNMADLERVVRETASR